MERFVDRIIETDKKAHAIIENAQAQESQVLKEAKARATADLAAREDAVKKDIAALDAKAEATEKKLMNKADEDYIEAKHTLDTAFGDSHDVWLSEIVQHVTGVQ